MDLKASELCALVSSLIGLLTIAQTLLHRLVPPPLRHLLRRLFSRLCDSLSRVCYVEIHEVDDDCNNDLYRAVKLHLGASSCRDAKHIRLSRSSHSHDFTYSYASDRPISISFQGVKVTWKHHNPKQSPQQHLGVGWKGAPMSELEQRKYVLQIQKDDKARMLDSYMDHIVKEAKEIRRLTRERRLYTNRRGDYWESVAFSHPSTFQSLAMDPRRKEEITADLRSFTRGEHFYKRTGRAWKRGYLLHGPPGTGKSSMIAAMANFLRYDVYDLELTHVRSNAELRRLLCKTTDKSIIVIEDIDCSVHLTNRGKKSRVERKSKRLSDHDPDEDDQQTESVTLSGLLNFTDGLWSCCGDERIFIFTTNHIEKLDPALLRSGRMDMHILMSYCKFPAFKILASNYLCVEDHYLFPKVDQVIDEAHITPAEVSEILLRRRDNPDMALNELLTELEVKKAKPWPPPHPSVPSEDPPEVEVMAGEEQEEVKKALFSETKTRKTVCNTCLHCRCAHEQKNSSESAEIDLTTNRKFKTVGRKATDKSD